MRKIIYLFLISFVSSFSVSANTQDWKQQISEQLLLFGHRNWILVVDAAYPLQSKTAIKTIVTGEDQLVVVNEVLHRIENSTHVYPEVFIDKEIDYVPEESAVGINAYKKDLNQMLEGKNVTKELHETLIEQIDEAAKTFNILILKTNMDIPYTSVFFRLECGYWNARAEETLRKELRNKK